MMIEAKKTVIYIRPLSIPLEVDHSPSSLELISGAASWQTSSCQRPRNLQMILDKKDFALSLTGSPVSLQETALIETRYS